MSAPKLKIAITGAAGLVGSGVVKAALEEGHSVVAIDRRDNAAATVPEDAKDRYEFKNVDVDDYEAYLAAVKGCDAMVHLAVVYNTHDDEGKSGGAVKQNHVHNKNVAWSYNTLCIAEELGINRVALASSVNSIGMVFSKRPQFDYLPVDEKHPFRPEDAYSISKQIVEIQSDSFVRKNPSMRIATLRFHLVVPDENCNTEWLEQRQGSWKDLWGWVSVGSVAQSCLKGLTAPYETFAQGTHETFFIVAPTTCQQRDSQELQRSKYPEITDVRMELKGSNVGFISTEKAKRMLDWEEKAPNWWHAK